MQQSKATKAHRDTPMALGAVAFTMQVSLLLLLLSSAGLAAAPPRNRGAAPSPAHSPSSPLIKPPISPSSPSPKPAVSPSPKPSKIPPPPVASPELSPVPHPLPPAAAPETVPGPLPAPALSNATALDPDQLAALKSLNVPIQNPDNICAPYPDSPFVCDQGYPKRHLISLTLKLCAETAALTKEALVSLSTTLKSLSFFHCPLTAIPFPSDMTGSLESLSIVSSLGRLTLSDDSTTSALTGVWLSRFHRLTKLEVRDIVVNASGIGIILSNMTNLEQLIVSNATLGGRLLRSWPANLTVLDLSNNRIQGALPTFFGELQHVETLDLSGNNLTGHLPESLGHLHSLQKLVLAGNAFWGPVPKSFVNLTTLMYLDFGGNKLNGSFPDSITSLSTLTYLDLRNNDFSGILPLNTSTIQRFNSFKVAGNPSMCYNSSATSSKLVTGLAKCDGFGNPIVPSTAPSSSDGSSSSGSSPDDSGRHSSGSPSQHKGSGAKKIVWAIATALGAIFLFIVVVVVLSRWCKSNKG